MRKNITISNDLNADIKAYCKKNGITNSQLIETATRTYLALYKASIAITDEMIKSHKIPDAKK